MTGKMDIIWTAKEAAAATGGTVHSDWVAIGISIDTRTIKKGELFVALNGDARDGHEFVKDALAKGAMALVSHVPDGVDKHALLIVPDTLVALQDLGQMLASAFGVLGQTYASKASYNNHWGVPLSLSSMHAGCDTGIFEIGMNHSGEITPLSQMVHPDIAIITTIAPVHMAHFESVQQIADAKAEVFDGMNHNSAAILNRDNEWFAHLKASAETKGVKVYGFGEHEEADARLVDCMEAANGSRAKMRIVDEEVSFTLLMPGRHIMMNALAVLLAVKLAGGDVTKAAKALETMEPLAGRGLHEYIDIGDPKNPVTLIDESYNASPIAMNAAFKVLALIDPGRGGRRIAVLGDMYELGPNAAQIHRDLCLPLEAAGVNLVYTSGPLMKSLYAALPAPKRGGHEDDTVELAKIVPEVLVPGDVVMVKGSRGGGQTPRMKVVVEALRTLPEKLKGKKTENAV